MSKTEQLNKLFEEWKAQRFLFCEDGIVNEETYIALPIKPLFILKDVNNQEKTEPDELSEDGQNINMRSAVLQDNPGTTWNTIAQWTEAFTHPNKSYFDVLNTPLEESLKSTAFLNVKKDEGTATVCYNTLKNYAIRDRELILRQIKICEPNIVIACSPDLYTIFKTEIFKCTPKEDTISLHEKAKIYGHYFDISAYIDRKDPVWFVEYRHPSRAGQHGTAQEHYENMCAIRKHLFDK